MGKLSVALRRFIIFIFLLAFSFISYGQTYDKKVADYISKVENPYSFLQRIEKIGVKDVMNGGSIGLDSAYRWLKKMSEQAGYITKTQSFIFSNDTLKNIEFVKKGTLDSCIIIGAHYDSRIGVGVNDNGTGDFALYQIAKLLKGITTKYTVRFVYFSGEEIDYLGSKYYVSTLNKDSVKIKFMLNLDQLGGTIGEDNSGIKCERDEVSAKKDQSNALAVSMAKIYSLYTNLNPVITPAYLSDYLTFRDAGYLISGIYQYSSFPYYHSEGDLLKYVELNSLTSTVKGALAFILYFSEAEVPVGITTKHSDVRDLDVYYSNNKLFVIADADYSIAIFDGLGSEVFDIQACATDASINLVQLKTGVYFAQLKTQNGIVYKKFLVEP